VIPIRSPNLKSLNLFRILTQRIIISLNHSPRAIHIMRLPLSAHNLPLGKFQSLLFPRVSDNQHQSGRRAVARSGGAVPVVTKCELVCMNVEKINVEDAMSFQNSLVIYCTFSLPKVRQLKHHLFCRVQAGRATWSELQ
jgi:hypothetical protein